MAANLSRTQFGDSPFGRKEPGWSPGVDERALTNQLDEQDEDYDLQQQVRRGHLTQAWRLG